MSGMTEEQAWMIVGKLAVRLNGFDDEVCEAFVEDLIEHNMDWHITNKVVRDVLANWQETYRPAFGVFLGAHRDEQRRREMAAPKRTLGQGELPTWGEGVAIAKAAYERVYKRPPPDAFDNWAAAIGRMKSTYGVEPSHGQLVRRKEQQADEKAMMFDHSER